KGTKEWVTCVPPGTAVSVVPDGETAGHQDVGQISLCEANPPPPNYEGKILLGADNTQYWIRNGQRLTIQNPIISACIQGRTGSGLPISVSSTVIQSYPDAGRPAWCPYPDGALVREQRDTKVWKVFAN